MRRIGWVLVLAIFVGLSTGCALMGASSSSGHRINHEAVAKVVKGQTTATEVERLMGKPQGKQTSSEGMSWSYSFQKTSAGLTGGSSTTESVVFVFDQQGVVKEIQESQGAY